MKRSNLYLVVFIGLLLGASVLNGILSEMIVVSKIKGSTYLNQYPKAGDLFVLKDTGDYRAYFKVKEEVFEDKFSIIYGKTKFNWKYYSEDYSWYREAVNKDFFFNTDSIEYKSSQDLKALLINDEIENNSIWKYSENPIHIRIIQSYIGFPLIVLIVFLMTWLLDSIGWNLHRFYNKIPRRTGFYLISLLGILYIIYSSLQFSVEFFSGLMIFWNVFVVLSMLGLYNFFDTRYFSNFLFSNKEASRFAVLFLGGITSYIIGHFLSGVFCEIIFNEGRVAPPTYIVELLYSGFLIWTAVAAANFLNNFRKHFQTLRKQGAKLKAAQKNELSSQAELDALQARINPHFLYNSLNSIASLAQIDPAKTEAMAMALSKFYKYSTNRQDEHLTSVSEEIEMLKTYLEIEKIRFGNRLQFEIKYEKSAFAWRIPRFLIQPIVENAIKHGYNSNENNIKILVEVKETSDDLNIMIFDNGTAFPKNMNVGYGLRSVQKKLKLLFPEKHELAFVNAPKKCVLVRVFQ